MDKLNDKSIEDKKALEDAVNTFVAFSREQTNVIVR